MLKKRREKLFIFSFLFFAGEKMKVYTLLFILCFCGAVLAEEDVFFNKFLSAQKFKVFHPIPIENSNRKRLI
jgi:hypothetical protein